MFGIAAITLHGRTREEYFSGECDLDSIKRLKECVNIPVIVSGGTASVDDIFGAVNAGASAVAIASILHYGHYNILEIKKQLRERGVDIRP